MQICTKYFTIHIVEITRIIENTENDERSKKNYEMKNREFSLKYHEIIAMTTTKPFAWFHAQV